MYKSGFIIEYAVQDKEVVNKILNNIKDYFFKKICIIVKLQRQANIEKIKKKITIVEYDAKKLIYGFFCQA